MAGIVYFSNVSENTHRFVQKLDLPATRIPLTATEPALVVNDDFVVLTPTYGAGKDGGAVPKQVIRFLNNEQNRSHIRGVISGGNSNFHDTFCLAGDIISAKCQVPHMYRFEILGTPDDVTAVRNGLDQFWTLQ